MTLFRKSKWRLTDDEFVARIRQTIALWDRWRTWMILLHVGLLAAAVLVFSNAMPMVVQVVQPANAPWALLGFILGATFGWALVGVVFGLIHGLTLAFSGFRTERLLIKFYDENLGQTESYELA